MAESLQYKFNISACNENGSPEAPMKKEQILTIAVSIIAVAFITSCGVNK